jgi:hypothetical protein
VVVEGHAVHQAVAASEVEDAAVDGGVIVPQREGAGLPLETALVLGPGLVREQEVEHGAALALTHAGDLAGHQLADEQEAPPGVRVRADHRVLGGRQERAHAGEGLAVHGRQHPVEVARQVVVDRREPGEEVLPGR